MTGGIHDHRPTNLRPVAPDRGAVPLIRPGKHHADGCPRHRPRLRHGPDRAGDVRSSGAAAHLDRRPRDRHRDGPAPDVPGLCRTGPVPSDQQVDLEAVQAHLPVARTPLGLRLRVPGRPHREPRARPLCRRRRGRRVHPGPLDVPVARGSTRDHRALRLPDHRPDRSLHEAAAAGQLADHPSRFARGVRARLAPRDPRRHGLGRPKGHVCRRGPGRPVCQLLSILDGPPGTSDVRHIAYGGHRTMSVTSNRLRRTMTLVLAVAALLLGFAAIRAASAWTAEAAPLVVSPTAAADIEAKLVAEQARTLELEAQIATMSGQADELTTALRAAQERIVTDGGHADQLAADLAAARARLKKLEAAIKAASAQRTTTVVSTTAANTAGTSSGAEHEAEH